MEIKGFVSILLAAALSVGVSAFAAESGAYVSSSDDVGFTVTADTDVKVKLVAANYDNEGRFVKSATMLTDAKAGDNTYTYAEMEASGLGNTRKIMLWTGEENSIEPFNRDKAAAVMGVETNKYEVTLQKAVDNGLITSYKVSEINENITKAEVAAILVNAVGATVLSTEKITDIDADAWYAESVSKAVEMGAFELAADGSFNPENTLTCQEVYEVLAKMLRFDGYTVSYASGRKEYVGAGDVAVLDTFADKDTIDSKFRDYAAAIVDNGGFAGFDGLLKGDSMMTKGEFAYIMDELVGTYIDEPGTYKGDTLDPGKTVIIRSGGVTVDSLYTDRNLIIAYSVDTEGVKIKNSEIIGATVIMGGADPANKKSCVSLQGTFADVRVVAPWIAIDASGAKMDYYRGHKNSVLNITTF